MSTAQKPLVTLSSTHAPTGSYPSMGGHEYGFDSRLTKDPTQQRFNFCGGGPIF